MEIAGSAEAPLLQANPPSWSAAEMAARARHRRTGRRRRDQKPRQRRRRFRHFGKAQQQPGCPRGLGTQGKTARRRQIETARLAAHLADGKGHAAAGERRLEGPQRIGGTRRGDADNAARIEPQRRQPRRVKLACLAPPVRLADPHNGTLRGTCPIALRHQRHHESGRTGAVAAFRRPDFMQFAKCQSAAQHGVQPRHAEGLQPGVLPPAAHRPGRCRLQLHPGLFGKPPFKAGNIPAQAAKNLLRAMTGRSGHGRHLNFVLCLFYKRTGR